MAIKAALIFNNNGTPRLTQWYQQLEVKVQMDLLKEIYRLVSVRPDNICNFLEGSALLGGQDTKIIYRHYATLYFCFVVDSSESELGILDLIQVFVESLDRIFTNVCELDLIFRPNEALQVLGEVISGGLVLETNINEIVLATDIKKGSLSSINK
ncbi:AP complex, mu/sigma subunit [Polychytrium aggregatum]|uniref:AP complex, mu/sigma subunit n=1 Tax=Polychytrium aggregatum TaxID=110093 RepID=UPI0022FE65B8|nr:AP complex, mu/sigma subunit [Polychytrium aggregatum]KAI9209796.1 AP complex, mu/sigma subunit [Polychytrium aggregatum]